MKSIAFFLLFLFISFSVYAQQWRLAEEVNQEYDYSASAYFTHDSIRYGYYHTNELGGLPDGNPINYDIKKYYLLKNGMLTLEVEHEQLFMPDKKREVDTRYSLFTPDNTWGLSTADSFYYKNDKLHEQVLCKYLPGGKDPQEWAVYMRTYYGYDTAGNLIVVGVMGRPWIGHGFTMGDKNCYSYDSLNRLIRDSVVDPAFLTKETNAYIYDSSGLLTRKVQLRSNNSSDTMGSTYYLYDTMGRLLADSTENYFNQYYIYGMHTYTYYPDGKLHYDTTWGFPMGKSPRKFERETEYFYNQEGLLSQIDIRRFKDGIFTWGDRTLYTYEIYWPNSVSNIGRLNNTISVFPVPTSGVLNITVELTDVTEVRGTITDIQGRILRSWTDKPGKNNGQKTNLKLYSKQVQIHAFASGNYIISLDTGKERCARMFVVK